MVDERQLVTYLVVCLRRKLVEETWEKTVIYDLVVVSLAVDERVLGDGLLGSTFEATRARLYMAKEEISRG